MRLVVLAAGVFALHACDSGPPADGCRTDSDCPPGHHCVIAASLCIGWSTPFDAAVPDLAPDLLPAADGPAGD